MKNNLILTALLTMVAVSCLKTEPRQEAMDSDDAGRITFAASDKNGFFQVLTKTDVVTSLPTFYASASTGTAGSETKVWDNVLFTYDNDRSLYAADKYWPRTDPSYHFRASNVTMTFAAGDATVSATNTQDVVCAYEPDPTFKEKNTLTFEHIFARIGDVTVTATGGYTISDVTITLTPKVSGTYNIRTGSGQTNGTGWSSTTDGSVTTICSRAAAIEPSANYKQTNDVWLVPGSYTLTASWTATKDDYTETFTGKNAIVNLAAGKVNAIAASIVGDATEITFGVTLTAWGTNSIDVGTISL